MHDPWLKAHKIAFCFFAAGCIALAATGLATMPRPQKMVVDLAARLEGVSAFAAAMLTASDHLLSAAVLVRPAVGAAAQVLNTEMGAARAVAEDAQCTTGLLESFLSGTASLDTLGSRLAAVTSTLRSVVAPAMDATLARLNDTYGTAGTTPALAVVTSMPSLLEAIRDGIVSYNGALAALPSSRLPTSASDPAFASLQIAQSVLNLPMWISQLGSLYDSLVSVTAAAAPQQAPYSRLAWALMAQQQAAASASKALLPLIIAVTELDTLYLGTPAALELQPQGDPDSGRACLARLHWQLSRIEEAVFRFSSTPERTAIDAVHTVWASLEQLYGVNVTTAAAGTGGNGGSTSFASAPRLLADGVLGLWKHLAGMANMTARDAGDQCSAVQSKLSTLPNTSGTLSYIASLRSALLDLEQPAAGVAAALAAYTAVPQSTTYINLYDVANAIRIRADAAMARATAPLPSGASAIVSTAGDTLAAAATSSNLSSKLLIVRSSMSGTADWLQGSDPTSSATSLARTTDALDRLQTVFALIIKATAMAITNIGSAQASPSTSLHPPAGPSASSPPPSSPMPSLVSTFLSPVQTSVQLIVDTLSNGIAAVDEELDNALGKVMSSPSIPPGADPLGPPPPQMRRHLLQSPSTPPSNTHNDLYSATSHPPLPPVAHVSSAAASAAAALTKNASAIVRHQLVERLDDAAATLRSETTAQYTTSGYGAVLGVYSAVMAVCLLLGLAMWYNYPAGLVVLVALQLFMALLLLLGAWSAAAAAVVVHDACGNADVIVLGAVSPNSPLSPLARYYLEGVGGSLSSVLRATGLGDTFRLRAAADLLYDRILDPLLLPPPPPSTSPPFASAPNPAITAGPWPGSLGSVQYVLGGVLVDLTAVVTDVSSNLTLLLRLGDRTTVLAQYTSVTSWACCGLGDHLMMAWICATGCGILGALAGVSGMMVLRNLDYMPGGRRCGCSCYSTRDYSSRPASNRSRRGGDPGGGDGGYGSGRSSGGGAPSPYGVGSAGGGCEAGEIHTNAGARAGSIPSWGGSSSAFTGTSGGASDGRYDSPHDIHWPAGKQKSKPGIAPCTASAGPLTEVVADCTLFQEPVSPSNGQQQQQQQPQLSNVGGQCCQR